MHPRPLMIVAVLLACMAAHAADPFPETVVKLANGGFDNGLRGWSASAAGASVEATETPAGRGQAARLDAGASLSRTISVDRGRVEMQGRRCLVRVTGKVVGDTWLRLRLRIDGQVQDTVLREEGEWQTLVAVVDTPPYLPGSQAASLSLELSAAGTGHALVDEVRVSTLAPYHLLLRVTVLEPTEGAFDSRVHLIRRHRDTNHADGVRHQYFSTLAPAAPTVAAGQPSAWIDLQRYLFGDSRATATVELMDAATGQRAANVRLRIEFAVPGAATAPAAAEPDALDALDDDGQAGFRLDDDKPPEPVILRTLELAAAPALATFYLPENGTPPERFAATVRTVEEDVAERFAWLDALFPDDAPLPKRLPVAANISALDGLLNGTDMAREVAILRRIGLSATARGSGSRFQEAFDQARGPALAGEPFRDRLYARLDDEDIQSPYDGDRLRERLAARYAALAERLKETGEADHIALIELMDEPPDFGLTAADEPAFRDFLRELGVTPAEVGAASWEEVRPWSQPEAPSDPDVDLDAPDLPAAEGLDAPAPALALEEPPDAPTATAPVDPSALVNRRLRYYTRVFIARRTADLFKLATTEIEARLPAVRTSVNFRAGIRRVLLPETADWFEFGRRRAVTMLWNEDWLNTYGWRNHGIQLVSYYTELMHAAARPHDLPHGCFVIVMGHALEKAYSALAHGATRVSFWRYGPAYANYLPYSWSHQRQAVEDIATFTRHVAAIEDIRLAAERHPASVALLYAKADPLWGRSQTENRLVGFALLHDQIPWEIVTEAEVEEDAILDRFQTLYVTDVSVRRATQERLAAWVRQGGAIWLSGGAASRDEFDEPCTVLYDALGIPPTPLTEPLSGTCGQGRFQLMHQRPGELYEQPVRARFNRNQGKGRIQSGWPAELRTAITAFAGDDPATRPVRVDTPGVEAVLYRHPATDLLFLIDYTGGDQPPTIAITLRNRPDVIRVESLRQGNLPLVRDGNDIRLSLPLERADTLLLHHTPAE